MMTHKTQNVKQLIKTGSYKTVLSVTYRRTLARATHLDFNDLNFTLYLGKEGQIIKDDKVICSIDSLHKYRGKPDLLILDEFDSVLTHLVSFAKDKNLYLIHLLNLYRILVKLL